jgi:MFS family permease
MRVGFLAAEFPTQYLAQHISRLGMYLGVNIMLWGIVLACHAACTTFAGLAVCRTLLGVFESCVAPILVLIIAMWYKKEKQGKRVSWFYVCNSLTAIFGGLLAYGVSFAKTKFASWRIFFVATGHWSNDHIHWRFSLHLLTRLARQSEEIHRCRESCCTVEDEE